MNPANMTEGGWILLRQLDYPSYEAMVYRFRGRKIGKNALALKLLASAFGDEGFPALSTIREGKSDSKIRSGERGVPEEIKGEYSDPDPKVDKRIHENVKEYFGKVIAPLLKQGPYLEDLLRQFKELIDEASNISRKDKKRLSALAVQEPLAEFLAETFILAVKADDTVQCEAESKALLFQATDTDHAAYLLNDIRIDAGLYVKRSIEDELLRLIADPADSEPHIIIGDAGHGKSTLLWSLYHRLKQNAGYAVYFESAELIIEAWEQNTSLIVFEEMQDTPTKAILLIDTADLLLHNEKSRRRFIHLLDQGYKSNITIVCASRPLEARQVSLPYLRRHTLDLYDEGEMRQAAASLAGKYCPRFDVDEILNQMARAAARGLPVTDVCRSPLLLRMLFELSSPNAPELTDVDVTSLYENYWDRRILRDARTESASVMHIDKDKDLSVAAYCAGIGLLSCGMPEMADSQFAQSAGAATAAFRTDGQISAAELGTLKERGVLLSGNRKTGFIHQTMFEFAAAKGLIASKKAKRALAVLTERTCSGHGDLFVGAVLEQMFILARRNPALLRAARQSVAMLLSSPSEAIQSIAVVAWAHDMSYLPEAFARFVQLPAASLERAVKIIPSIAAKTASEMIGQLTVLWDANRTAHLRSYILNALSRIALNDAKTIAELLAHIDPLQSLKEYGDEEELSLFRKALLSLLKVIRHESPQLVREIIMGMLYEKNGYADIELEYLTELWEDIGSEAFLMEVLNVLSDPQNPNNTTAEALGTIMSAEYVRSGLCAAMEDWAETIEALLDPDSAEANAERTPQIYAVAHFLLTLRKDDKRLTFAADRLLSVESEYLVEIVGACILPMLLDSGTPAAAYLIHLASNALLSLQKNIKRDRVSAKQALILYALSHIDNPAGLLGAVLPENLDVQSWLAEPMLTRLLAVACMGNMSGATEALFLVESGEITIPEDAAGCLFDSKASYFTTDGKVYDALIHIAIRYKCADELCNFVHTADWQDKRLRPHISKLFAFARDLLRGDEIDRINGMGLLSTLSDEADDEDFQWSEYYALLNSLDDPEMLCELLRAVGLQNEPGSVEDRISYFREYIEIRQGEDVPVYGTAKLIQYSNAENFSDIAESIRLAFLELLTLYSELNDAHWNDIRLLSLYPVGSGKQEITGGTVAQVCNFLQRAAFRHSADHSQTERWLSQYLMDIVGVEIIGNIPELYCDALSETIVEILNDMTSFGGRAIELAKDLSYEMAMCIISTVAENNYEQARDKLQQIAAVISSLKLKSFILDLIRDHDRSSGTRAFAELVEALADE